MSDGGPTTTGIALASVALALALTSSASAQEYKTDIPPDIVTPDSVETRLSTLRFADGRPDSETVAKVYDNLHFQRGVSVFLSAMPGASLVAMLHGLRKVGADTHGKWLPRGNKAAVDRLDDATPRASGTKTGPGHGGCCRKA